MIYKEIKRCRICGNIHLIPIISLGDQALTGIFPKNEKDKVSVKPLELVKCDEINEDCCGLVQLRHNMDPEEMYGENYGYRSGLNNSMVEHLRNKVNKILKIVKLSQEDMIIDIGSNDSTLLQFYPKNLTLLGIDPTGKKFKAYYPEHIQLIPDFFSDKIIKEKFGDKKAKVITSIAMFYDLEDPTSFMKQIYNVLDDAGVWVFEQSYMPTMLEKTSYDTICHEHLEYYRFKQIKWMADKVGFKIVDVEFNDINGGSFSITVAKKESAYEENMELTDKILKEEKDKGLATLKPYEEFKNKTYKHREELVKLLEELNKKGKKVFGYGASTKGNVILQFCNITKKHIPFIAEVNPDKFGSYTPATNILIISEKEAKNMNPDYFLVLPWHFREFILKKEEKYIQEGGKLIFPLPSLEIVQKQQSK